MTRTAANPVESSEEERRGMLNAAGDGRTGLRRWLRVKASSSPKREYHHKENRAPLRGTESHQETTEMGG